MLPIVIYSDNNGDNKSINGNLKSIDKNRESSKNNPLSGERRSMTILGDSLSNGINEKGLSHKHIVKVVNKPGATSERILNEMMKNQVKNGTFSYPCRHE